MSGRNIIVGVGLAGAVLLAGSTAPAWARQEVAKLTPSDGPVGGVGFGQGVAIKGDDILVGAPFDGIGAIGAAYVFTKVDYTWVEQAKLIPSDGEFNEAFGVSVTIDGDLLVVGAPYQDAAGSDFGWAYVFVREGTAWVEEAKLISSGSSIGDHFGRSVWLEGDLVVVGAPGHEYSLGGAYIFRLEGTTWVEEAALIGSDTVEGDGFGNSVSISGDVIVVGAPYHDDGGSVTGSAYVFRDNGANWIEETKLTASDTTTAGSFGACVSVSGDAIAVARSGGAYIFREEVGIWTQEGKPSGSGGLWSVSLDGEDLVVGAYRDSQAGDFSGSAYLYHDNEGTWVELDQLVASDAAPWRMFGSSVAISADYAIVGGIATNSAYIFLPGAVIPAMSGGGMLVLAVLVVIGGTVVVCRHRPQSAPLVSKD